MAASHRVPRPTNTDLIPAHGEPKNVKEDPTRWRRWWCLWRSEKASAGSGDLASRNKSHNHPSLLDTLCPSVCPPATLLTQRPDCLVMTIPSDTVWVPPGKGSVLNGASQVAWHRGAGRMLLESSCNPSVFP